MTAATAATVSPTAVFKRPVFVRFWSADFVSTVGNSLTMLAAGILVFRLTGTAASVGLMLMATSLPSLLVGLVAGVFVDRYDRRMIMVGADLTRAVLVFLIPILVPYSVIWLYVIVFLTSTLDKFFQPAHESVLPELAPDEELAAANSFLAISNFGSTAIGFAASGLIASAADINWAFWLDSVTFLVSSALIFSIKVPKLEEPEELSSVSNVFQNLRQGLNFLFDTTILRSSFLVGIPVFIGFGLWNVLLLPFADRALHATEFVYGLQEGLTSLAFVFGSLLMAGWADRLREGQWISIGFLGMGLAGAIYSQLTSIPLAILFVMISGFLNAPSSIGRRLIFQRNTTREIRGRVSSAYIVSGDVLFIIGMGLAGLADIFDVRSMMLLSSVIIVAAGAISLVLPGLGQPASEWRRAVSLLRGVATAPSLAPGRPVTAEDFRSLARNLPVLNQLSEGERSQLFKAAKITEAEAGTAIVREGETSTEAYFIVDGEAVAGKSEEAGQRSLETLNAGDFFGEIAAITNVPRTADVVVSEDAVLMRVPADGLRAMMANPEINRLFLSTMTDRLLRLRMIDAPRFTGLDQRSLRELRSAPSAGEE